MADTKISALTSGNPAQSTDEIPIARSGANFKITAGSIAALGGDVDGPASSVDNQIALFDSTSGKLIKAASTTGLLKASSGVIAAASSGTDYAPATTGTNAQLLANNGSGGFSNVTVGSGLSLAAGTLTATGGGGGGLTWQSVQSTGFTAVAGNAYPCNTTSAAFTVTLPASPSAGQQVQLLDYAGTWGTNNLTVARNGNNINGGTTNLLLTTNRGAVTLTYVDATQGWVGSSSFLNSIIFIDYLTVGGGGGGGDFGGGGAGGFRTGEAFGVNTNYAYSLIIGGGGAGASTGSRGSSGSNSTFGVITSNGGGGGGAFSSTLQNGVDGASGGGAGTNTNAPTYTPGTVGAGNTPAASSSGGNGAPSNTQQGRSGGNAVATGGSAAGGGGGSNATTGTGGDASTNTGGNGGAGTASTISGSLSTYSGGGGGGGSNVAGTGGAGGGGAGRKNLTPATSPVSGSTNSGGGGGGGFATAGAAGGSGVIILKIPSSNTATFSSGVTSSVSTAVAGYKIYTVTATSTTSETVTFS